VAEGKEPIDNVTYLQNEFIIHMRDFYLKNFNLFAQDDDNNLYLHGALPLDKDGDISIGRVDESGKVVCEQDGKRVKGIWYQGKEYQGKAVLEAFTLMAEDVRKFDPDTDSPADIREALALYTAIFTDENTIIKPSQIVANAYAVAEAHREDSMRPYPEFIGPIQELFVGPVSVGAGYKYVLDELDVDTVINGHNPQGKMRDQGVAPVIMDEDGQPLEVNADGGMAKAFGGDAVAYVISAKDGIVEHRRSKKGEFSTQPIIPPELYQLRHGYVDINKFGPQAVEKYKHKQDIYNYNELWPRKDFPSRTKAA
jgi:hypothetical protein